MEAMEEFYIAPGPMLKQRSHAITFCGHATTGFFLRLMSFGCGLSFAFLDSGEWSSSRCGYVFLAKKAEVIAKIM